MLRSTSVLAALLLLTACGSTQKPRAYYDSTGFRQAPASNAQRAALASTAKSRLKGRKVAVRQNGKTAPVTAFEKLPVAVLQALLVVSDDGRKGAEADLLIPVKGEGTYPVTVVVDLNGSMVAEAGPKLRWPTPKSEGDLQRGFGTGPLQKTGRSHWDEPSRLALQSALERLSAAERKALVAMPFVRAPNGKPKERAGQHIVQNCGEKLFVYDRAFQSQGVQFVGTPSAPLPASAMVVLHELGHALHSRPGRLAYCAYEREVAAVNKAKASYNAKVKRYNQLAKQNKRSEAQKVGKELEREGPALEKRAAAVKKRGDQAGALLRKGPVLAAYQKVLGKKPAPTRYGEQSVQESFAESFALYHADPDALGRVLPAVLAWFRAGGHLKALGEG